MPQLPCNILLLSRLLLLFLHSVWASDAQLLVQTDSGPVQGVARDGVRKFLGVPFAASTAPPNRFKPPQLPKPWVQSFDASKFGPGCYQGGPSSHNPDVPPVQSEDCLNVNVYAPLNQTGLLPVLIWFHGGAFKEGCNQGPIVGGSTALYDGSSLVRDHDVIIVAANYRMTGLGWMALSSKFNSTIGGNFGLMDQRASMEWVRRNAKAFGGDPTKVTLWGESAGAMSIGIHLSGSKSAGLFSKAIMESNVAGFRYRSREEMGVYGSYFIQNLPNCSKMVGAELDACIQTYSAAEVHHAADQASNQVWPIVKGNFAHWLSAVLTWTPVVDGDEVKEQPTDAFAAGRQQKVPILIGSNTNEGATFVYDKGFPGVSGLEFKIALPVIFGAVDGTKVASRYSAPAFKSAREPISRMITDFWFRCSSESLALQQNKSGIASYAYRYNHAPSFKSLWPQFGLPTACEEKVCHMAEIPFVFNNYANYTSIVTPEELLLAKSLGEYWMSFVKTGRPTSSSAGLEWPQLGEPRTNILLESGTLQRPNITFESAASLCGFWDSIGYVHASEPPLTSAGSSLYV